MSWFQNPWVVLAPILFVPLIVLTPSIAWAPVFRADALGLVFLAYLLVLGTSIHRFARRNLAGDPARNRFLFSLTATLWAVQGLALSANLGLVFGFWLLTSLGLHRLLGHFGHRPGARIVVWQKFRVSRLGDLALVGAGTLLWVQYGTLDLGALEAAVASGDHPSPLVGGLLVLGALTKGAQVPFHAWLPRTLEAPTPVSALLHAGVINAGGWLLLRCWFLLKDNEVALTALVIVAGISAVWGGLVLVVQADTKRRLAWSTVGQMGFLFLEIGLGAPALAFVHLMGHGLYKARAFLWSGEAPLIPRPPRPEPLLRTSAMAVAWLGVGLAGGGVLAAAYPGHLPLAACVWAAVLPLAVPPRGSWSRRLRGLLAALGIGAGSVVLAWGLSPVFGLEEPAPGGVWGYAGLGATLALALAGLAVAFSPALGRFGWYRAAYASALHGFGFGRWFPRMRSQGEAS